MIYLSVQSVNLCLTILLLMSFRLLRYFADQRSGSVLVVQVLAQKVPLHY